MKNKKGDEQSGLGELRQIAHFLSGCSGLFFDQSVQKSFDRAGRLIEKESDMLKRIWEVPGAVIIHQNILIPSGTIVFRDYFKKHLFNSKEFEMYVGSGRSREPLGIRDQVSLAKPLVITEYLAENASLSMMRHTSMQGWIHDLSPEEALYITLYLWELNHESFFYFYRSAKVVFYAPNVRGGAYGTFHLDCIRGQGTDGNLFLSINTSELSSPTGIYKDVFFLANAKNQSVEHRALKVMTSST